MSEDQLSALLAKLKEDAGLQEKLKGAADLDAALAMANEAGFNVSKADLLSYQAEQTLDLSDEELEGVAGGAQSQWETQPCPKYPRCTPTNVMGCSTQVMGCSSKSGWTCP
jgi:predicted ribosomally synthesized peptide with nif11-like leader